MKKKINWNNLWVSIYIKIIFYANYFVININITGPYKGIFIDNSIINEYIKEDN